MRWHKPYHAKKRVIKRFALLPIGIRGEWRWLEICYIKQRYDFKSGTWFNEEFVEAKEMHDG